MFKMIIYLVVLVALIGGGIGCFHLWRVAQKNQKEMSQYEGAKIAVNKDFGKVLIVYYSLSGHTKDIAQRIQQNIGGDLYEIKTKEELNKYPWFPLLMRQRLKNMNYPELAGSMPDFNDYDTIFVGAPVWWYTMAVPMYSFLQKADFNGKKVVAFSTQGSNVGSFFEDFSRHAQNAKLGQGASFNNLPPKYDALVDNKIAIWLNSL